MNKITDVTEALRSFVFKKMLFWPGAEKRFGSAPGWRRATFRQGTGLYATKGAWAALPAPAAALRSLPWKRRGLRPASAMGKSDERLPAYGGQPFVFV